MSINEKILSALVEMIEFVKTTIDVSRVLHRRWQLVHSSVGQILKRGSKRDDILQLLDASIRFCQNRAEFTREDEKRRKVAAC